MGFEIPLLTDKIWLSLYNSKCSQFTPIFAFLHLFVFVFQARTGQTDRQTDKTRNVAY